MRQHPTASSPAGSPVSPVNPQASRAARRSHRLTPLARAAAAVLLAAPLWLQAQTRPNVLPTGLQIVQGQASVATLGGQMTVRNSPNAILNWQSFNIGAGNKVAFEQASAASKVLNRVTGNDPSAIFGSLTSNGQVWLLNPNGVLFGPNARVDVAGLVTSTLRLNDNDFLQGRYRFSAVDGDSAGVRNEGALTSSFGGQIVLIGQSVQNTGSIDATGGNVSLAAARSVELVDTGLPHLTVKVDVPAGEVLNLGKLAAAGGTIDVYGGIVNQSGLIQADTLGADAQGRIVLRAADTLTLGEQSRTQALGSAEGATGGRIDLLGAQVGVLGQAEVDVSGAAGGGSIRLGGGLQGQDTSVPNSRAVYFGPDATLRADASGDTGQGGRVIMWSNEATRAYGTLSARGGRLAGDGGFIETSGGWLDARPAAVDVSARAGHAGSWLLDPNDIAISDTGPDTNVSAGPSFTTTGDSSVLTTATIAAALNAGTSVTVSTGTAGSNLEAGDITMLGATLNVNPTAPVGLTLRASRDILVYNSSIVSTGSALTLDFVSAIAGHGTVNLLNSTITTRGGDFTLGGDTLQTLPTPTGFTSTTYKPAIGYLQGSEPAPKGTAGQYPGYFPGNFGTGFNSSFGVLLSNVAVNLGTGTLRATGLAPAGAVQGVLISDGTTIAAGQVTMVGSSQSSTVDFNGNVQGHGVTMSGQGIDVSATLGFSVTGYSSIGGGIVIGDGARLSLAAASGSGASFDLLGDSGFRGINFWADAYGASAGRGSRITVSNASYSMTGNGTASYGIAFSNDTFAPGPALDLAGATSASFDVQRSGVTGGFPDSIVIPKVAIVGPQNGATTFTVPTNIYFGEMSYTGSGGSLTVNSGGFIVIDQMAYTANGGNLTLNGADVGVYGSNFNLNPASALAWTVQSQRDVVILGTTLTSTGSAVSLDLQAASSGIGAIEIASSSLTTAGGNVTLGGSISQQLPRPGGGFTAEIYKPAVAYTVLTGNPSITSSGGNDAVTVRDSTLNLGSGTFKATGYGTLDNRDAITIGSASGTTQINAGRIELVGYTSVPAPVQYDVGVYVRGNATDLTATAGITIEGGGRTGVEISDGARVTLNAAPASGATFTLIGFTSDDAGLGLLSDNFDLGTAGRGSRITVNNAAVTLLGVAETGAGLVMLNDSFAPGPLLDFSNATSVSLVAQQNSTTPIEPAVLLSDVELVLGRGITNTLQANGKVSLTAVSVTGENATLSMSGSGFSINASTLAASAGTLALDFATTGAAPTGVLLENTIITTGGGDVRFGASQTVSSSVLGSTTVAAPWVETTVDNTNYSGSSVPAALWLLGSTIDAGAGRVYGGGAARTAALNAAGVTLDGSVINASEISLAGRSESESAINVLGGSHTATHMLNLDALASTPGYLGMFVGNGATLRLSDPTAATGSGMSLQAVHTGATGPALSLEGGNAGSALETTVSVDGGTLLLSGTAAGSSAAVQLLGRAAAPGGLLINALGATSVSINATKPSSTGAALSMSYMNLLGPQNSASSPLNITASGGRLTGTPSTVLTNVTLSSGGPVNILTDGLLVTGSRLSSDTRLALQTNTGTGGRAAAPIAINNSTLEVSGAAAELRIEGSAGDAVRGELTYNAGQGLTLTDSTLQATGSGAQVVLNGRGSDAGGTGVTVVRSTFTGENIAITGRGLIDGDGVWVQDTTNTTLTTINATNLTLTGQGADTAFDPTHVGVLLGNATVVNLSGRGAATITGDTVLLGNAGGAQPLVVSGDAASFTVASTGSQRVVNSTLDFSAGAGTAVTLQADSDASLAGRVRLESSTVRTGGGNLTLSGVGVHTFDQVGDALPRNLTVLDGAAGVLLTDANTIDAGAGTVTVTGRGASDGRPDVPTNGGSWGILGSAGTTDITAGSILLSGDAGDKGFGIDVGVTTAGSVLNLDAPAISVTGRGVGIDPNTSTPYAGIAVNSPSLWLAGGGTVDLVSTASGMSLNGITLIGNSATLTAGGPLTLVGSTVSAGTVTATAVGAPVNGSLFSIDTSTLTASAALSLDATATAPGAALSLLSAVNITGGTVSLSGTASGATSNAPGISASAVSGSITATSGPLTLTGRNPALDTEGILLEGGWALSAPNEINLVSDGTTLLRGLSVFSPTFSAAQSVNLTLNSPLGITLGDVASALDAGTLATAVASLAPTATLVLTVPDPSGLLIDAPFTLPAKLQVRAEQIDFSPTGSLTSTAPGDAILLTGVGSNTVARFDNQGGSSALVATVGRWVVQLTDPASAVLGGLGSDFTAYNLATTPWATDASGNLITPAAGNAIGFAVAPAAVAGTALGGLLTKVYDATTGVALDPLGWTVNGLVAGDTLTLSGATSATLADKNVGTGKAVTLNPASVFAVVDAGGKPVFGYDAPVFTATVTPATLVVTGAAAANKVYDSNTAVTLAAGSVAPLAGDVVALGAATGNFADKNVGTAKAVTLSGLALTGADAGNYTLVLPTGLTADITPAALPIGGVTANVKTYDATTAATLTGTPTVTPIGGDVVLLAGTASASFADKNVGAVKAVSISGLSLTGTDAGNYTLQQPGVFADITALPLPLTGLTAVDKVYDATTLAPLSGTAAIAPLAGDTVTLAGTAAGSFGDKNVGANKLVGLSGLTLAGADAGNYLLNPPVGLNASITALPLPVSGLNVANKVYDGTTVVPQTGTPTVAPLAGDTVTLLGTATADFGDKNVGTGKLFAFGGLSLGGTDAGNYVIELPIGGMASITPLALPVTGLTANAKVYDTTTAATLSGTATVSAVAGDSVLLAGSAAASFADKNAGTAKPVAVAGFSLGGVDAGNYTLVQPAGLAADITPLALAVTGLTATAKVYDAGITAPLAGSAAIAPLAGDTATLAGTAAGSFASKTVGTAKPVTVGGLTLGGADAANYTLLAPTGLAADITPAAVALGAVTAADKVYDATAAAAATASLTGVLAGDAVTVGLAASFADANVGTGKTVNYTATPAGADAANYILAAATGSATANITPATLTYGATPLIAQAGSALALLTGNVTGFVGGETLAGATTGTLAWTTLATGTSPAGSYAIDGSGLAALNYQFVQAPGNATALTLSVAATVDPATASNSISLSLGLQSVQVSLAMSSPTEGRVLDVTPAFALGGADGREGEGLSFRPVNFSLMTRNEAQSLLAARASYKKKVFASSLSQLEQDPALADVRPCKTEAELAEGNCLITEALKQQIQEIAARAVIKPRQPDRRKIKQAVLPTIERKLALLIGINKYADKRVPELEGSLRDTRAIRTLLEGRLGYETTVVEDASREAMIRAFNKLALEAGANDSVVIYYAGHGDVVPVKGEDVGFWIPSDANADNPATWLSNADIARLVGAVGARQLMLISDSCFSGSLAGSEKVQVSQTTDAADLLKRKAAVVMSSGGNEPVADEGREGHSFFAWHFMRAIEGLDNWQVGGGLFERVRAAVVKDFPQTPQYGASRSAGHQGNTDYLFERREFEAVGAPVPVSVPGR